MRKAIAALLALIAGYAFYIWISEQSAVCRDPKMADLTWLSGRVQLTKPWKTSPYLVLEQQDGVRQEFSCTGPFGNGYWCSEIEAPVSHRPSCTIGTNGVLARNRLLVIAMHCEGRTLVEFATQVKHYAEDYREGPSASHLLLALGALTLAIGVLFGVKK